MRPRNYVGLACTGHDNAVAIVDSNGIVRFAEATERHLQSKRALDAPPDRLFHIAEVVETYCEPDSELVLCLTWSQRSAEVVGRRKEQLETTFREVGSRLTASSARTRRAGEFVLKRQRSYQQLADMHLSLRAAVGRNLAYHFPERLAQTRAYDHHLTHAAWACHMSPFAEAACVVIDGFGEATTASAYHYHCGALHPLRPRNTGSVDQTAGLGLFYADLCTLCGFDQWRGEEWKVMGLAAYGEDNPGLRKLLGDLVQLDGIGFRRSAGEFASLARLLEDSAGASLGSRAADLARAGQRIFEARLFGLCRNVRELVETDNLVLSGGCALNSSANGKVCSSTGFTRLHIPCAPADDGNAVGAALLAYFEDHPEAGPKLGLQSPYLGSRVDREALERAAQNSGLRVKRYDSNVALCEIVAERLCAGDLVGWMQGRAEFGPRALGNRSILADPRRTETKDALNRAVKYREDFRPFAPAILSEYAAEYFEDYQESPYMERTLTWRAPKRGKVPAAVHVDGTGRVQTVKREWNPLFHMLLSAFHERSDVPVLINTSFNVMGKPIVHSVEDAMAVFVTTGLHLLAIENYVFFKKSSRNA